MSQHLRVSGSFARSISLESCLSIHVYLRILCKIHVLGLILPHLCISRILCKIHVSGLMLQHDYISGSSARSMSPDSCLSIFASHDHLQDPYLQIHVSTSLFLRILYKAHVLGFMFQHPVIWILYKIHVFGFMSQHLCISGSSARCMSLDSCPSIHVDLRLLCKTHVSGSVYKHPQLSHDPLQDPCLLLISRHLYISGSSARSTSPDSCLSIFVSHGSSARPMSPDPCLSSHLYLTILCKIQVSGFMSQRLCLSWIHCKIHVSGSKSQQPFVAHDPLQDPSLRIHVSPSLYLTILCNIHVSGFMSQRLCISGSSARPMSPDPCFRIHVSASFCLRILCKNPRR